MKKFIPNAITLCNLLCGVIAVIFALWDSRLDLAAACIVAGIFFDFFDGLAARLLKVPSELGKQLDSLADLVTSGLAPAVILWVLLGDSPWRYVALAMPLFAAYRLAKFNIDERQHTSFRGLPTPANALVWASLGLWNPELTGSMVIAYAVGSLLLDVAMVCDWPMMSLKFKSFAWKEIHLKVYFLIGCGILLALFRLPGGALCIFFYIVFSLFTQHD